MNIENEKIDLNKKPISEEAMPFYCKSNRLFGRKQDMGHPAPKKFIGFSMIKLLANEMGRQITVEDLKILLCDEGRHKCHVTQESKRAIGWVALNQKTVSHIAKVLNSKKSLKKKRSEMKYKGGFYLPQGKEFLIFISGVPFPEDNDISALKMAINSPDNDLQCWGFSFTRATQLKMNKIEKRQKNEEARRMRHNPNKFTTLGNLIGEKIEALV